MSFVPRVLSLVGPTASGKTPVSIQLAQEMNGEIISADSRQIFRYLDIGTAKPGSAELKAIPHHFISILEPDRDYSAGEYGKDARQRIVEVLGRRKNPIIVGGSGLYVKGVVDGLFEGPGKDPEVRAQLEDRLSKHGAENLLETLQKVDPVSAQNMDATNHRRIIRALEIYYITGLPISKLHAENKVTVPYEAIQFAIRWDRQSLYQKINDRVDEMIKRGLVEEVGDLRRRGYDTRYNALNTVGYKEVFQHLDGKLSSTNMVELIKQNTRRFAKRQLTWFRADKRIRWIQTEDETSVEKIVERIRKEFDQKSRN
ncbi:MAG TPA: tRNA (adenosine(37)-N6)-dimethylallyltransferase MiaA [Bacteroidota bacterium]|nr:tRNA (adenosine(37)-N6)-dimethylallyltransferase MiaA [Bacteroidota bacterium]